MKACDPIVLIGLSDSILQNTQEKLLESWNQKFIQQLCFQENQRQILVINTLYTYMLEYITCVSLKETHMEHRAERDFLRKFSQPSQKYNVLSIVYFHASRDLKWILEPVKHTV